MTNFPGGHQQSLMPTTVRSAPGVVAVKADVVGSAECGVGKAEGVTAGRWNANAVDASGMSRQRWRMNDIG
jgi:hypothetical protein